MNNNLKLQILQGFAGMCFGYLLSTLFDHQADAMQCAIGSFYPMLLLSGILWPLGTYFKKNSQ